MQNTSVCLNCETPLHGKFCHACGQKVIEPQERRLSHFVYQFFGSAFFLENNFLKNLWYLLVRPGFLPLEYISGKRKRHMAPISLFFLINLVYFFASPLTDLNLSLRDQTLQPHHRALSAPMVESRLAKRGISFEEYSDSYEEQSTALSKSLIILHIPVMAVLLLIVYWKRRMYFTDHIIFSLYLMGFVLLGSILFVGIILLLNQFSWANVELLFKIYGVLLPIILLTYFVLSIKKFYGENWLWTVLKTPLVIAIFLISHFAYRTLLFFIVFWTT